MALFQRQRKLTEAIQARLLRLEWRAQLHEMNGDLDGSNLNREVAVEMARFATAKANRVSPDDPTYLAAEARYVEFRGKWRAVRRAFPRDLEVRAVEQELYEPSDEELLAQ